jgi:glycosyltransferase involved in cell wall biosynthesis
MRILFTIHHHLQSDAGAPGVTIDLGQAYAERGHEVEYISFDDLPRDLPERAKAVVFPHYVAFRLRMAMRDGARQKVVDASSGDAWCWAAVLRRGPGHDHLLVWRSHGLEHVVHRTTLNEAKSGRLTLSWKYPLYHGGFRLWEVATALRRSDLALFLNRAERDHAVERLGLPGERARVVPNGVRSSFLGQPFFDLPPEGSVRIAQIGSYIERKGVAYGMPALASVLSRHRDVSISFLGTGCGEERVLADLHPAVHGQVRVVPAYPRDELPRLLEGHHIMFFPTLAEGFSTALIEAMACGLVPVATAIGANMEAVQDGSNGLIVPPRDTKALADALELLLTNRHLLTRLRRAAHTDAQRYGWHAVADRMLELYREGLDEKGSRR